MTPKWIADNLYPEALGILARIMGTFAIGTLFLVHDFWNMEPGPERQRHSPEAREHVTVPGRLVAISTLSHMRRRAQTVGAA